MTPLKHSKGLAARMGRWSANHWKTAVFGWLALVLISVFVGIAVGTKEIKQTDTTVGESHTADKIISDAGFAVDENGESTEELGEMVIIQSKTLDAKSPAFHAAVVDAVAALRSVPQISNIRTPLAPGHADLISKDRHSAMITSTP